MSGPPNNQEAEPVLPPRERTSKVNKSVYLPAELWEALEVIAQASGEYSRNEVIEHFLRNRVNAWNREQAAKRTAET